MTEAEVVRAKRVEGRRITIDDGCLDLTIKPRQRGVLPERVRRPDRDSEDQGNQDDWVHQSQHVFHPHPGRSQA